jgi:hypothetical protein
MITQLTFGSHINTNGAIPMCIWAENFPIDLRVGEDIWIDDFFHLFESGEYYMPEERDTTYNDCIKKSERYYTQLEVIHIQYGMEKDKIVKMVTCKER